MESEAGSSLGKYQSLSTTDDDEVRSPSSCCQRWCIRAFPAGFTQELKSMIIIGWPIVLTQVCQMLIGPISLIFCGHLGDPIKLDGAALAISMINATCISVGQGLGTACDTFFSQSFGGTNKKIVGTYLQKAVLIYLLAFMVCTAIHTNMQFILLTVGQQRDVAVIAGNYMIIFIPGSFGFFMYIVLTKYVQNQNVVIPNVVIGCIANGLNAIMHYVLLYVYDMGPYGSAIAQATSYFSMFLMALAYVLVSKIYVETWSGWSISCLYDWGRFCRLAIPGMFMICLEWWGFEIGVFLTGLLGTTELGAQSVLLQLDSIWFQIPLGIQIACSIRVGQYLGAGSVKGAITASRLAIFLVVIISVVIAVLFLIFRRQLPYIFTNVPEIADLTGRLLPIVTLYMFFDGLATACKGVLYGTGRQVIGAVLLFISYYVLALPIGIPLMFLSSLRSAAYWWALAFNLVLQSSVLFTMVYKTSWTEQVKLAQERAGILGEKVIGQSDSGDEEEKSLLSDSSVKTHNRGRRPSRRRMISASLTTEQARRITEDIRVQPFSQSDEQLSSGPLAQLEPCDDLPTPDPGLEASAGRDDATRPLYVDEPTCPHLPLWCLSPPSRQAVRRAQGEERAVRALRRAQVLWRRGLALLICLLILTGGICTRVLIDPNSIPSPWDPKPNSTLMSPHNITTEVPQTPVFQTKHWLE